MDQKAFFFIASSKRAIQGHFGYFMNKSISNSKYFQRIGLLKRVATYQAKKIESILFFVYFRLDFFLLFMDLAIFCSPKVCKGPKVYLAQSSKHRRFFAPKGLLGGFQLVDLIITELKNHMTCFNSMALIG